MALGWGGNWDGVSAHLDQGAIAVGGDVRVEVVVMEDGGEATDDRLQAARVLLDHGHHIRQAACRVALRALDPSREEGGIFLTHAVESCKHRLGVHHWKERTAHMCYRSHVSISAVLPVTPDVSSIQTAANSGLYTDTHTHTQRARR